MTEWGVTPEYINNRWTEELLTLMFVKRTKRIKRTTQKEISENGNVSEAPKKKVKDTEMFAMLGIIPEVVRCQSK